MSMLSSWFGGAYPLNENKKQSKEVGTSSAAVVTLPHVNNSRQASIRRSSLSKGLLSPSQILAKLRSSSEFHVGRFSSSYVLDGVVLGQGTFGCVRRCFSSQGGRGKRFFAAKEIRYAELKESEVEDILSEVDVMRSLNHQHICHLKEAWLDGAKAILVQELLEGVDGFAAVLEKGAVADARAKDIMWQLASAVAYCHSKQIVHRDIKLENIMLVNGGQHVKLVDFGLATRIPTTRTSIGTGTTRAPEQRSPSSSSSSTSSRSTHSNSTSTATAALVSNGDIDQRLTRFCGTPHYMSPEIVNRIPYGRPADVWAMGVLLYMLLSGETLWEDAEPSEVCASVKRGQWSFNQSKVWNHKSSAAKELIQRMLDPNPKQRLTAFSVCCADWLHVASDNSRRSLSSSSSSSQRNYMHSRREHGEGGNSAASNGVVGGGDVVYSHAMMRSVTFQETLDAAAPSKMISPEAGARLGLLHKREYLHVHVSQLVQFCSAATTKKNGADEALGHLLTTAVAMARRVCGADRGSLFLVATHPKPHLWSKVAERAKPIKIGWNEGIAGTVAATGDALNVEDAYQDARFSRAHDDQTGYQTKSVLCVPVPHGQLDRPLIGVVQLINKQDGQGGSKGACFDADDEALLHDFCVHVGLALTALLLREDEELFNRQMLLQEEEEEDGDLPVPQERQDEQEFTTKKQHHKSSRHSNKGAASSSPTATVQPKSNNRNQHAAPRRVVMDRSPQKRASSATSPASVLHSSSSSSVPGSRKRGHYSTIEVEEEANEDSYYRKRAHSPASPSSPSPSSLSSYSSPTKRGRLMENEGLEAPRVSPTRRALPPPPPHPASLGYLQPNGCVVS